MMAHDEHNVICMKIKNDEFFGQYLSTCPVDKHEKNKVDTLAVSERIKRLSQGLELLSTEIQNRVQEQHSSLLTQANHACHLGKGLEAVGNHVIAIQAGADRLKGQVAIPCNTLETQTKVLGRLHEASHVLRQISRFLQLYKRLQILNEPAQQALMLAELEPLCSDLVLANLDIVRDECKVVSSIRQRILAAASRDLRGGLKSSNQSQLKPSIEIFSNLNYLNTAVTDLLSEFYTEIRQLLHATFEGGIKSHQESTAGKTPLPSSQNFKSKVWIAVENLFSQDLYIYCKQILLLQQVLLENSITSVGDVMDVFWSELAVLISTALQNTTVRTLQTIELDLPKFMEISKGLENRLGQNCKFSAELFQPFVDGYLRRCKATVTFNTQNTDPPNQDMVDAFVRSAITELSAALVDMELCTGVGKIIMQNNTIFWECIERNIKRSADAIQIVDVPNVAQLTNISLANVVYYHGEQMRRLVSNLEINLPAETTELLIADLSKGERIISSILEPVFDSVKAAISAILLSLHQEPGLTATATINTASGSSLYMRELGQFIGRITATHLAPFDDHKTLARSCRALAIRCIELFVRHVSVVRPVSVVGRQKLRADCTYLESALRPLVGDLAELGKPYRLLRSMFSLLDASPQEITLEGSVPSSTVLLLLFSHAGPELASPHTIAGWKIDKLCVWLDSHTAERDRLEFVAGALQKYRTVVRQRNSTHYDPVYPIIVDLLEKAKMNI